MSRIVESFLQVPYSKIRRSGTFTIPTDGRFRHFSRTSYNVDFVILSWAKSETETILCQNTCTVLAIFFEQVLFLLNQTR
jgi:hypothetical protein